LSIFKPWSAAQHVDFIVISLLPERCKEHLEEPGLCSRMAFRRVTDSNLSKRCKDLRTDLSDELRQQPQTLVEHRPQGSGSTRGSKFRKFGEHPEKLHF
jgi:hypothetical protein